MNDVCVWLRVVWLGLDDSDDDNASTPEAEIVDPDGPPLETVQYSRPPQEKGGKGNQIARRKVWIRNKDRGGATSYHAAEVLQVQSS